MLSIEAIVISLSIVLVVCLIVFVVAFVWMVKDGV